MTDRPTTPRLLDPDAPSVAAGFTGLLRRRNPWISVLAAVALTLLIAGLAVTTSALGAALPADAAISYTSTAVVVWAAIGIALVATGLLAAVAWVVVEAVGWGRRSA